MELQVGVSVDGNVWVGPLLSHGKVFRAGMHLSGTEHITEHRTLKTHTKTQNTEHRHTLGHRTHHRMDESKYCTQMLTNVRT